MLNDIEEISRYARDEKVLSELYDCDPNDVFNTPTPNCIIIHPQESTFIKLNYTPSFSEKEDPNLTMKDMKDKKVLTKIEGFSKFYKMRVELPLSCSFH